MRRLAAKAAPYAPAALLLLAVLAGGLRSPAAWLFFAAACCAWFAADRESISPEAPLAPLLFFGWLGAAAVFSPYPPLAWPVLFSFALAALFFYWSASSSGGRAWETAVYALAAAASATFIWQRLSGGAVTGFIGSNPNYSAAFCAAAFPAAALRLSDPGPRRDMVLRAGFVLLLAAGLAAAGSRGAALAAALSSAAAFAFMRRWRWLAVLAAVLLAAAVLLPEHSLSAALKLDDPKAYARPLIWGAALKAAAASPLLGWGPGSFGSVFEIFKFPYFDGVGYYGHSTLHAHSELLNLAAEAGFPAAIAFFAVALWLIVKGGRENLPFRLFALALLIQASVDIVFYSGAVLLLFWGSLGFAAGWHSGAAGGRAKILLAGLCCAGLALSVAFGKAGEAVRDPGGGPVKRLAEARRAALLSPKDPFAQARPAALFAAAGEKEGNEAALRRALELEPNFAAVRLSLAGLLASSGRPGEACGLLEAKMPELPEKPSAYQRKLLEFDAAAAAGMKKELCGKKKAGGGTAPPREKR